MMVATQEQCVFACMKVLSQYYRSPLVDRWSEDVKEVNFVRKMCFILTKGYHMPVLQLKAHTVSSYSSSVGLMFACVGRGRHHYRGKRNVESVAFRKHFPKTPLLGYFGSGEIGFKILPGNVKFISSTYLCDN
jgi:hypothetical protein